MEGVAQRFEGLKYNAGFGNGFETEVLEGTVPKRKGASIQIRTARLSSSMESSPSSYQARPLLSSERRTNGPGFTK